MAKPVHRQVVGGNDGYQHSHRRIRPNAVPQQPFLLCGRQWYFTTREGFDSGPFATRERAEIGLKRFLHVINMLPAESREMRIH
ncbi:DUF6316 family protein [Marinobacter sp. AN1]|uniref:DUF6316 family protein n=1 Tax=Marinobacter sp. AN1 TaxID=2886046 RepID=UPI0039B6F025